MPTHAERRLLPYSDTQLFDLVASVERYPDFLPWCKAVRIRKREGNIIHADLVIGWKLFRETFRSRVTLDRPRRIDVTYLQGPLKYLNNHWIFEPRPDGTCEIDFYVDFEFNSKLFQKAMGVIFNEAVSRMVRAFEARAHQVFGRHKRKSKPEVTARPETPAGV